MYTALALTDAMYGLIEMALKIIFFVFFAAFWVTVGMCWFLFMFVKYTFKFIIWAVKGGSRAWNQRHRGKSRGWSVLHHLHGE